MTHTTPYNNADNYFRQPNSPRPPSRLRIRESVLSEELSSYSNNHIERAVEHAIEQQRREQFNRIHRSTTVFSNQYHTLEEETEDVNHYDVLPDPPEESVDALFAHALEGASEEEPETTDEVSVEEPAEESAPASSTLTLEDFDALKELELCDLNALPVKEREFLLFIREHNGKFAINELQSNYRNVSDEYHITKKISPAPVGNTSSLEDWLNEAKTLVTSPEDSIQSSLERITRFNLEINNKNSHTLNTVASIFSETALNDLPNYIDTGDDDEDDFI